MGNWADGYLHVSIDKQNFDIAINGDDVVIDGDAVHLSAEYLPGSNMMHAEIDGEALSAKISKSRTGFIFTSRGKKHDIQCLTAHMAPYAQHMIEKIPPDLSRFLICPMPGLITALHVEAGEKVEAGQPLATVEAMKMENILRAEKAGIVKVINAAAGESLAVDAVILEME